MYCGINPTDMDDSTAPSVDLPRPEKQRFSTADGDTLAFSVITSPAKGTLSGIAPNLTQVGRSDEDVVRAEFADSQSAEGDQQVSVVHRHVGGVGAVHAGHRNKVGVRTGQRPQTHQGAHGRGVERFHEVAEFVFATWQNKRMNKEFAAYLRSEIERYAKVAKAANLKAD